MHILCILSFILCVFSYKYPKVNLNLNHMDKQNLEKLERMFYLKNSRYNPMRNRIYMKYLKNETETYKNEAVNITSVLENINDQFIKSYKETIEADEREEYELENQYDGDLIQNNNTNDYDEHENERKKGNKNGYFDKQGVFRYNGTRIIITNHRELPNMIPYQLSHQPMILLQVSQQGT